MCSSRWICECRLMLMQQLCWRGTNLLAQQLLPCSGDQLFNRPFASFVKTTEGYEKIPAFLKEEMKKATPDTVLLLYLKHEKKGSDNRWKGFHLSISVFLQKIRTRALRASTAGPLNWGQDTVEFCSYPVTLTCAIWKQFLSMVWVNSMIFHHASIWYLVPDTSERWVCVHMKQHEGHGTHFSGWSCRAVWGLRSSFKIKVRRRVRARL